MIAPAIRSALDLVCPGGPGSGAACSITDARGPDVPDDVSVEETVRLLALNKVPLVPLAREWQGNGDPRRASLLSHPSFAAALAAERERRASLIKSWLAVASEMDVGGIRTVLFKSPWWFPYLSSNLDVLVEPGSFERAAAILERLGHIRFPHYREDHKLLFRTFEGGEPGLSVHLHEAVSWGKVLILEGGGVVARSAPGEEAGFRVASPVDVLTTTLAHTVLETDQVRLSDLRTVRWCLERGASVEKTLEGAGEGRWLAAAASALAIYDAAQRRAGGSALLAAEDGARVDRALADLPWARRLIDRALGGRTLAREESLPLELPRSFSKNLLVRLIAGDDRRDPDRRIIDLGWSAWNLVANRTRVRCRPGSLITISGPDGAGKSRLADSIAAMLSLCEVPVTRIWSRGGFSSLAVAGKAMARRIAPAAVPGTADESAKRAFLRSGWRRALWSWLVALEQALSIQRIRIALLFGRTVVCDRYVYDSIADLASRLPALAPEAPPPRAATFPGAATFSGATFLGAASFLLGAARKPDLAFLIQVSPEVAHLRKDDGTSVESRARLVEAYAAVASAVDFTRLNGDRPYAEIAQTAVVGSIRRCFASFERRST